jgi:two-component system, NarL family, nitrate/nitrite response regulator NarL
VVDHLEGGEPVAGGSLPLSVSVAEGKPVLRLLVADMEGVFRLGLQRLFATETDLCVVCETDQPEELLAQVTALQPDVIFVQLEMLGTDSQSVLQDIRSQAPGTKLVVMASAVSEDDALAFMKLGARGVILRTADPALFVKCARKVAENEIWLRKAQVAQMARLLSERTSSNRPVDTLTKREKLVISCLVQGRRNREIAKHLSITEQTVKNHLRSIYDKVGVSDRVELVLYTIHQRLELPPVGAESLT